MSKYPQTTLAIDPSKNNLGFALWQTGITLGCWQRGVYHPPSELTLEEKLVWMRKVLMVLARPHVISSLVIEYPTFQSSIKGQIAAQKGYTIDLGCVCGFIIGCFPEVDPLNIHLYTPMQWKGTMPKSATTAAYRRIFGARLLVGVEQDAIDATMMLHWHLRKLKAL